MLKKLLLVILALISVFAVLGCEGPAEPTAVPTTPSLGSTPAPVPNIISPQADGMYVANGWTRECHFIDCILSEEIPEGARRWFAESERQKAIDLGYSACSRCNPW